jgi:hypothetical protein
MLQGFIELLEEYVMNVGKKKKQKFNGFFKEEKLEKKI